MVDQKIDAFDPIQQYCRMLGHKVPFAYCRSMNANLPCRNTLDCWKDIFAVKDFVQHFYSKEEISFFLEPPKPKLAQIFEIMTKAKKSTQKK
jgi:hypothetical protein